jgi:hypothetical protein
MRACEITHEDSRPGRFIGRSSLRAHRPPRAIRRPTP